MVTVGHKYTLEVLKVVDFGVYLDADDMGEVLLPGKYIHTDLSVGDSIDVFLYDDSEGRPVATTQMPVAEVGQFAYLPVVSLTSVGAFLDWGLDKDILVPFAEQHRPMESGHSYLVYLYRAEMDGRIVASSKIDKFLDDEKPHQFKARQAVDLIIANTTDLGYKAIINHSHWGVLHKTDVFQRLSFGQSIKGYIKTVREDGKIDLILHGGTESRDRYTETILVSLKKNNGYLPVHDKSSPEIILKQFGMSKGAFKKAIGGLYKQRVIRIEKDGIYLLTEEN